MAKRRHTYTRVVHCSPASVGLAQACPNKNNNKKRSVAFPGPSPKPNPISNPFPFGQQAASDD